MGIELVQVQARWKHEGRFEPIQFMWKDKMYRVESTGRSWEDAEGIHVLCMIAEGKVYELIFRLNPAGWVIRPAAAGAKKA